MFYMYYVYYVHVYVHAYMRIYEYLPGSGASRSASAQRVAIEIKWACQRSARVINLFLMCDPGPVIGVGGCAFQDSSGPVAMVRTNIHIWRESQGVRIT